MLATLDAEALDLPDSLLARLLPPAFDYPPHREFLGSRTAPAFDALGAAGTAAEITLQPLLAPERLARLVDFHRRDPALPGAAEVLDAIVDPKRYRYGGPIWLLNLIWKITPKPDLIVLLDAPAEVIQQRKKEVPFEETAERLLATVRPAYAQLVLKRLMYRTASAAA